MKNFPPFVAPIHKIKFLAIIWLTMIELKFTSTYCLPGVLIIVKIKYKITKINILIAFSTKMEYDQKNWEILKENTIYKINPGKRR